MPIHNLSQITRRKITVSFFLPKGSLYYDSCRQFLHGTEEVEGRRGRKHATRTGQ